MKKLQIPVEDEMMRNLKLLALEKGTTLKELVVQTLKVLLEQK